MNANICVWYVEALPSHRAEVIAGKYIIQYIFSAGASALVVPLVDKIGVGWTFTICMFPPLRWMQNLNGCLGLS
jgi:hypothetical protein